MAMTKVVCDSKPIGLVTSRQPKSPGQGTADCNRVKLIPDYPHVEVWANSTKSTKSGGPWRCTKCGSVSHSVVLRK